MSVNDGWTRCFRTSLYRGVVLVCMALVYCPLFAKGSHAQVATSITPSSTDNLGTTVTQSGNLYNITGGKTAGANLFHSFGNFSVGAADSARFQTNTLLPDTGISNILGRVTGGQPSNIFGTINSITYYPNANLFLMNPAGIVFGPNATLNVGGAAHFTTAGYIKLADGVQFNAVVDATADALLSTASVSAFGFLGSNAASIAIQGGTLEVQDGKTLSFIGGSNSFVTDTRVTVPSEVAMTAGRLSAPNGLIHMETVTTPGEVALPVLSGNPIGTPVSFPGAENAVIRIQSGEFVMKGASLATATTGPTSGTPIGIDVEVGGQMTMQNVSTLSSSTTRDSEGGAINVSASTLAMDASSITGSTSGQGTGGKITLNVSSLDLSNGAQIVTRTDGPGLGGQLDIVASDHVTVAGFDPTGTVPGVPSLFGSVPTGLLTMTSSSGTGGDVTIAAPRVNVTDGGHIASFGSGDGAGGNLTLNVDTLNATGGGQVWSSSGLDFTTFSGGGGSGGHITVNATDEILVSGGDPFLFGPSQVTSQAFGTGDGGSISLIAPTGRVRLEGGGKVFSFSGISMNGPITVEADSLTISGFLDAFGFPLASGIEASSSDPLGQGGGISVTTASVNVDQGMILNTGGPIALTVGTLDVTDGGQVTVIGAGANSVTATDSITVSGEGVTGRSRIESITPGDAPNGGIIISAINNVSVTDGGRVNLEIGNQPGGLIAVEAESITVASGGKVRMDVGNGGGGQLQLTAKTISLDQGVIQTQSITASSGGDVSIHADNLTMSGSFINSAAENSPVSTRSGNIDITITEALSITGEFNGSATDTPRPAGIYATAGIGGGDAGQVSITAGTVNLSGGARIDTNTTSTGQGGAVSLTADQSIALTGVGTRLFSDTTGLGDGGAITLQASQVHLANGATISTRTSGSGSGNAGDILVKTDNFSMSGGATITAASTGTGNAGSVTIEGLASPATAVAMSGMGTGIFTSTENTGSGGNILIETSQSTTLTNGAAISASSTGTMDNAGDAGMVTIHAGDSFLMRDSSVTTQATKGGGGQIGITASNLFRLVNSTVSSSVLDGTGGGGNITIDPNSVILQNSQILAQAVQGAGGNITITTPVFLADQTSLVDASSQFGVNGTVNIQSPTSNLSGTLGQLASKTRQGQLLMQNRCAALAGGEQSTFILAGRDTLPAEPGGWLGSPIAILPIIDPISVAQAPPVPQLHAASTEENVVSLRRMTPPGFLIQAFASDWSTGCHS